MSEKPPLTASTAKAMSANMALATASAEDATNNVDSVAVATEEMTATVSDIARNAEQARQVTTAAVSSVTVASQRVGELGRAAQDISQVTDVIIADFRGQKMTHTLPHTLAWTMGPQK